jgi:DNA-binding transcriptional LysR family regulator
VVAREVHFGLCTHAPQANDLIMLDLFRDEVCVIAPTGPGAARSTPRGWGEATSLLRRSTLVYSSAMPQAAQILDELTELSLTPARRLDCGDVHMVAEAALAGMGLAILPRRVAAHRHGARLAPLHPRLPIVGDTIRLLYRSDMHRTRAASQLTDALVTKARAFGS